MVPAAHRDKTASKGKLGGMVIRPCSNVGQALEFAFGEPLRGEGKGRGYRKAAPSGAAAAGGAAGAGAAASSSGSSSPGFGVRSISTAASQKSAAAGVGGKRGKAAAAADAGIVSAAGVQWPGSPDADDVVASDVDGAASSPLASVDEMQEGGEEEATEGDDSSTLTLQQRSLQRQR